MITELLAKLGSIRWLVVAVVALGIVYTIGYCSGDKHGSNSKVVDQLVLKNDSLRITNDSLSKMTIKQKDELVNAQIALSAAIAKRAEAKAKVKIISPGKAEVVVNGTPKVVDVPIPITDLLAQDEFTVTEATKALDKANELIKTLQLQVQVEHNRAESNWQLYQAEKDSKNGSKFFIGAIVGALAALGSVLVFR